MNAPVVWLAVTILLYAGAKRFYRRFPRVIFTPLLLAPIAVVGLILALRTPYENYHAGARWLSDMIGPATIALAVPLYKNAAVLRKHALAIVTSVFAGSTAAILSSVWLARGLNLSGEMTGSLAPHSATTPIAMATSDLLNGIPALAAVLVLVTGILGMVLGPVIIRLLGIRHDLAKGVLLGTGAHAAGTTKAFEFNTLAGSISSVSMILTGFFTLCTAPWLIHWMGF
ncbi:LrgB family protein [Gorillibacterium sp. sgz5001074]|uniref:LrgB family protein n=1 Tax=Gorillibacterium sp. sgz5001074 TaxID=3446695 RepID=UPI003F677274